MQKLLLWLFVTSILGAAENNPEEKPDVILLLKMVEKTTWALLKSQETVIRAVQNQNETKCCTIF